MNPKTIAVAVVAAATIAAADQTWIDTARIDMSESVRRKPSI